ncbi:chlorophyll a/b-binding protein [Nonlabens xiamenensis]|uniref:chlorophyll a/b-binding protein n=1 Tax=Nonlabens xiamenensis TaxID=2341043 RepID=UPI000F60AF11|nr:chlorophyll a/b-binding protein [Nonlabens xiamenensis]|tara:strand:+ start:3282 stop:3482 length:201 start_codon:yes stop_codon:yes gene_type:complete
MTVITEDRGRQNMFAKEPPMQVMDVSVTHNEKAELLNGRLAMLGILSAVISYAFSGSIFFFGAFGI